MKPIISFLLFTFVLFFISSCSKKKEAPTSYEFSVIQENFDSSKSLAQINNQHICLMIHASWCNVCNTFKADVLTDDDIINTIKNKIVFSMIDGDKDYGKTYYNLFGVSGFPTFLILDKNGSEIARKSGGMNSNDFKAWVLPYLK